MSRFALFLIALGILIALGAAFYILDPVKKLSQKKDMQRISDLEVIASGLESYYEAYGRYPFSDPETFEILSIEKEKIPWGSSFNPFINLLPVDPSSNRRYVYYSDAGKKNKSFQLYASLEDPVSVEGSCGLFDCPNVPGKNLCGGGNPCNYGVTSGNVSP